MNRRLWLVVSAGGVLIGAAAVMLVSSFPGKPVPGPGEDPLMASAAELPRALFERNEYRGSRVRLSFELPLTPTADPLVWEYRPGVPADITAPTYRIRFEQPPCLGSNLPLVVVGTVKGLEPDSRVRLNRVPGAVALTGATVVPRESP